MRQAFHGKITHDQIHILDRKPWRHTSLILQLVPESSKLQEDHSCYWVVAFGTRLHLQVSWRVSLWVVAVSSGRCIASGGDFGFKRVNRKVTIACVEDLEDSGSVGGHHPVVDMDFRLVSGLALAFCLLGPTLFVEGRAYREHKVPGYFVFGDSLLDVGTNNFFPNATAKANFAPYGETFFHKPTGRFSDGRNMGDFIAQALRLPFAPPFLQPNACFTSGANFASAGSGLLNTTNFGTVVTMSVQLQQYNTAKAILYKQLGADAAHELISKSIYVIATGSNDLGSGYLSSPERQKEINATAYITLVIEAYKNALIELYQLGARKAIVFGIAPLGCSPLARAGNPTQLGECLVVGNQLAVGFNAGLKQLVGALLIAFPNFHIVFGNSYDPLIALMADGDDFGVSNVTAACCGAGFLNAQLQCGKPVPSTLPGVQASVCPQPSKFLFWDVLHPTDHTVKILFKKIWNGNSTIAYPINLKTLVSL